METILPHKQDCTNNSWGPIPRPHTQTCGPQQVRRQKTATACLFVAAFSPVMLATAEVVVAKAAQSVGHLKKLRQRNWALLLLRTKDTRNKPQLREITHWNWCVIHDSSHPSTHTDRTHGEKLLHLSRVKIIHNLNLVQNHSSCRDEGWTAQISIGVLRLEEDTGMLPPLHGQQAQLQPP